MYGFDDYETDWYNLQYDILLEKFIKAYDSCDHFLSSFYGYLLDWMEDSPVDWLSFHPVPEEFYVH